GVPDGQTPVPGGLAVARPTTPGWLERAVVPGPLFLGAAGAFLLCCVGGFLAGRRNCYPAFERFHQFINIESAYYPTASQARALARARLDPAKVAVVVGGNSVLYGTGQRGRAVWTKELQALLGERYQVINLGARGAEPSEFGATAAEMLSGEYPRLIFISDLGSSTAPGNPDGNIYRYFFWDAYYKGLLPH